MVDNDFLLRTAGDPAHEWRNRVTVNTGDLLGRAGQTASGELIEKIRADWERLHPSGPCGPIQLPLTTGDDPADCSATGQHYEMSNLSPVMAGRGVTVSDIHAPTSYTATGKHYSYEYKGLRIDPYRIFKIYKITDPCLQHAIKKLLRAGRGSKPLLQDINEVISTLERMKDMIEEDAHE